MVTLYNIYLYNLERERNIFSKKENIDQEELKYNVGPGSYNPNINLFKPRIQVFQMKKLKFCFFFFRKH